MDGLIFVGKGEAYLSGAPLGGRVLVLHANIWLGLKGLKGKHASLFWRFFNSEGKKFYEIDTSSQCYETFFLYWRQRDKNKLEWLSKFFVLFQTNKNLIMANVDYLVIYFEHNKHSSLFCHIDNSREESCIKMIQVVNVMKLFFFVADKKEE